MTVAVQSPSISYNENGVTVAFAVPFRYDSTADLRAVRKAANGDVTELVNGVDFTATPGPTNAGGALFVTTAAPTGTRLTILRRTSRTQTADYITSGAFPAESHERALDKAMLVAQELDLDIARAVLAEPGETPPSVDDLLAQAAAAEAAAQIAVALTGPLYLTIFKGLEATTNQEEFAVDNFNGTATIYYNNFGGAVTVRTVIIDPAAPAAATLIGTAGGTLQAVLNNILARLTALEA